MDNKAISINVGLSADIKSGILKSTQPAYMKGAKMLKGRKLFSLDFMTKFFLTLLLVTIGAFLVMDMLLLSVFIIPQFLP